MSRILQGTMWVLAALAVCCSSNEAQAQRVRVGIGFGGGGVRIGVGNGPVYGPGYYGRGYYGPGYSGYNGPGNYGPGYGPGFDYGYRAPVVIAPSPVYVPQPVYVQPQQTYLPPAPTSIPDGGEILLFSPTTNGGDVNYTLNGQPFTMPPGTKQRFVNDRQWTVQFESAPGQVTTYTLEAAHYKFKATTTGLGLFQTQDSPEVAQPGLPPAPIPEPPEAPAPEATVIPSRPALKTTP